MRRRADGQQPDPRTGGQRRAHHRHRRGRRRRGRGPLKVQRGPGLAAHTAAALAGVLGPGRRARVRPQGRVPRHSPPVVRAQRRGHEGGVVAGRAQKVRRAGHVRVPRPPRGHIQVHARLARGRRRRGLRRLERCRRRDSRAHRQRRRPLGRRNDVHTAVAAQQQHGRHHNRLHEEDSDGVPGARAVQPAVPGERRAAVRHRAEHPRVALDAVRLKARAHEPDLPCRPRGPRRAPPARARRQVAPHTQLRHKGAAVLVHAARRRRHGPRGRDAVDRRGGMLWVQLLRRALKGAHVGRLQPAAVGRGARHDRRHREQGAAPADRGPARLARL